MDANQADKELSTSVEIESTAEAKDLVELESEQEVIDGTVITCKRCQLTAVAHRTSTYLCVACVKAENSRVSHFRYHNFDWMEVAKEASLEIWERQPLETDWEYTVWLRYRDSYPGKKPSYREVGEELNTSVNAVHKIASRWSFPARMQAWTKHCDTLILAERKNQLLQMNEKHISLAEKITKKLEAAIEQLDPIGMDATDVQKLYKVLTDVERKARGDLVASAQQSTESTDNNPDVKKETTSASNLDEVLKVLVKAGALPGNLGIRQTTTTEVVVKE